MRIFFHALPVIAEMEMDLLMKDINVQFVYKAYMLFVVSSRKNMKQTTLNMGELVTIAQKKKLVLTTTPISPFHLLMLIVVLMI